MTSRGRIITVVAAGLLLACGGSALSQTALDDPLDDRSNRRLDRMEKVVRELRSIVFQGKETGQPVVVQPAETPALIATLTDKITDLEQTLIKANGQAEVLSHNLDQTRRELAAAKGQLEGLEARLAALEERTSAAEKATADLALQVNGPPAPAATAEEAAAPPTDPSGEAFAQAYALLKGGDFPKAQIAFNDFVTRYGDTPKGAEARYWLGETLYIGKNYTDAAVAYIGALRGWPATPWAPDATLKLARSMVAIGRAPDACKTLDELSRRYPKAAAPIPARAAVTRASAQCPK